jgi:hypothetical protein
MFGRSFGGNIMLRTRVFALGLLSWTGCLGPLVEDTPGYSPRVLDEGAKVSSASDDYLFNDRIDSNDNVDSGPVKLKPAYALGLKVQYWDLGEAKTSATPAWQIYYCDSSGAPIVDGPEIHPLLIDAVPGDGDYTQFWEINQLCVTPQYNGEQFPSRSALSDAFELGLVREEPAGTLHLHCPVVTHDVSLEMPDESKAAGKTAFYRDRALHYLSFGNWGRVPLDSGRVTTGTAYEVLRESGEKPERVIFSDAPIDADGLATEGYSPLVYLATVVISDDADIETLKSESDLVVEDDEGNLVPANESILSVEVSRDRVARPIAHVEVTP